jgi:hypothetical protein
MSGIQTDNNESQIIVIQIPLVTSLSLSLSLFLDYPFEYNS